MSESNEFLVWVSWHFMSEKGTPCHDCHGFKW
jgi:hypothetical protein